MGKGVLVFPAMAQIDRKEIRRLARLARLALSEEEELTLAKDLGSILGYVAELASLDTSGIEPTAHLAELGSSLRADKSAASFPPDQAVANAPQSQGSAFMVPKVIESDEEPPKESS